MNTMTLQERMDGLEKRLGKNDSLIVELRDAVTVTAQLEAQQGRILKEHSKWLLEQEQGRIEFDRRMKVLDERIASLVSGFGEYLRRHQ